MLVLVLFLVGTIGLAPRASWAQTPELAPDRTTPRRVVEGFVRANQLGDPARAAQFLDLRGLPPANRADEGTSRAEKLGLVLGWTVQLDFEAISNDVKGDPADGDATDIVASVRIGEESVPIALSLTRGPDGKEVWLFSRATVAMVPALYAAYGAPWVGDVMPRWLSSERYLDLFLWQWGGLVSLLAAAYVAARISVSLFVWLIKRLTRDGSRYKGALSAAPTPLRLIAGVGYFELFVPYILLTVAARTTVEIAARTCFIFAVTWLALRLLDMSASRLEGRLPEDTAGELHTRGARTRLVFMRRFASILIVTVAIALALMQFQVVRTVGMSLLASAGIAGVVIGFAAQRSLAGLIAGVHLSITQPLRIGDTVVIEGEVGTIEAITLTYVILRVWDDRRLIIPVTRMLEQSFQNWSRTSTELLSPITIYADYTAPIDALREELKRLAAAHPSWDHRVCSLDVTDTSERTITIRALLSAADAGQSFRLRCDVREGLIGFLQTHNGGAHLPKVRLAMEPPQVAS